MIIQNLQSKVLDTWVAILDWYPEPYHVSLNLPQIWNLNTYPPKVGHTLSNKAGMDGDWRPHLHPKKIRVPPFKA